MKLLILIAALTQITTSAAAKNSKPDKAFKALICSIVGMPGSSDLRVRYNDKYQPYDVALRSPGSQFFRIIDAQIKVVLPMTESGTEAFSVVPNVSADIDWSKEPYCFKKVGSQWYFSFNHLQEQHTAQIYTYFLTQDNSCKIPRLQPGTRVLSCAFNDE